MGILEEQKARAASEEVSELRELIVHCWVHSGYRECGIDQMTTQQRELFLAIIAQGQN